MTLFFHPLFEQDVVDAVAYYREVADEELVNRLEFALWDAVDQIRQAPLQHSRIWEQRRRIRVKGFSHTVHFEVVGEKIYSYGFYHT